MAEQTTVVADEKTASSEQVTVTPEVTPEPLTEERIQAVLKSGDKEEIEKTRRQLFADPNSGTPTATSPKPAIAVANAPALAPSAATAEAIKKFKLSFHGEQKEVDDPDDFLGLGSLPALKKSKAHADLSITKFKEREAQAMALAQQHKKDAEDRAAELVELRKQFEIAKTEKAAPPVAKVEVAPAVEMPSAIELPDIPEDPTDWTPADAKAHKTYLRDRAEFDKKMLAFLSSRPAQSFDEEKLSKLVEERMAQTNKGIHERLSKAESLTKELEQQKEDFARQKVDDAHWRGIADFQATHSKFSTPLPIREQHEKVTDWMDSIITANGFEKPLGAYDPNAAEWQTWERAKTYVVGGYMANSPDILKKAEGYDPPKGYKEYFELANLIVKLKNAKEGYVRDKILGPNAGYHQIYLMQSDEAGDIDRSITELRKNEFTRGTEAVGAAIKESSQYAPRIPNDGASQNLAAGGITQSDVDWATNVAQDPRGVASLNVEGRMRYQAILKAVGVH